MIGSKPAALHEYADNTIHTMHTESGDSFQVRLLHSLGGDNGVGFSMACVFVAECLEEVSPRYSGRFVVKIFDPRYSTRLRDEFHAGEFDLAALPAIKDVVDSGSYNSFSELMISELDPPEDLSDRTRQLLSEFTMWPLPYGDVLSQALAVEEVREAFVADEVIMAPGAIDRELYTWVLSEHMFHHEASMLQYLNRFPDTPVVRLKEVASINPKTMASSVPSMSFGVIIMDLVDGYPMSKLKELCMMDKEAFRQAPDEIRKLIPNDKESARRFFTEVNHLIQFPTSVGVQSRDPNLDNIMCSAGLDGKGQLTWIDIAQFQFLQAKHRTPDSADDMKKMCLVRFPMPVNDCFEEDLYDSFSFLYRKAGCPGVSMYDLRLRRFRDFGMQISTTFAWRLIMEDICIADWQEAERPTDTRLSTLLIRLAMKIMVQERNATMQQGRPSNGVEKQDCFHRAVWKLYQLLCRPSETGSSCKTAAMDAVQRFEDLMAKAGYPYGSVVVSANIYDNSILMGKNDIVPAVENIVQHLRDTRIFPTRFWSADWSYERIAWELRARFRKLTQARAAGQAGSCEPSEFGSPESMQ